MTYAKLLPFSLFFVIHTSFSKILSLLLLDGNYLLFCSFAGRNLSMLPVEPKLGKMLILGAIFKCLDPVMTVAAGLSVRDPFLMPFDKKDVNHFHDYLKHLPSTPLSLIIAFSTCLG